MASKAITSKLVGTGGGVKDGTTTVTVTSDLVSTPDTGSTADTK